KLEVMLHPRCSRRCRLPDRESCDCEDDRHYGHGPKHQYAMTTDEAQPTAPILLYNAFLRSLVLLQCCQHMRIDIEIGGFNLPGCQFLRNVPKIRHYRLAFPTRLQMRRRGRCALPGQLSIQVSH